MATGHQLLLLLRGMKHPQSPRSLVVYLRVRVQLKLSLEEVLTRHSAI